MKNLLYPLVFLGLANAQIKVDTNKQTFVDEHGRTRIFHGYNVAFKEYPYIPDTK
jgi:hypothetical protein